MVLRECVISKKKLTLLDLNFDKSTSGGVIHSSHDIQHLCGKIFKLAKICEDKYYMYACKHILLLECTMILIWKWKFQWKNSTGHP